MKKIVCLCSILLCFLSACGKPVEPPLPEASTVTSTQEAVASTHEDTPESAMLLYRDFLASDNPQESEGAIFDKDGWLRYAFFDMNGDGISELHIHTRFYYYIMTCKNGELQIWKSLNTCAEPLNNGAVLETRIGTPMLTQYAYIEYDFDGKEQLRIGFIKAMAADTINGEWIYDETSEYWFGSEELSMKEWDARAKPYFSIGSDKIEWIECKPLQGENQDE